MGAVIRAFEITPRPAGGFDGFLYANGCSVTASTYVGGEEGKARLRRAMFEAAGLEP